MMMPSKLWRFEWSGGGTIEIKEKSRPKIGNFYDMIFMKKKINRALILCTNLRNIVPKSGTLMT